MINITSYIHRDQLSHLIRRWMYHQVNPTDAREIVRLVQFNRAYVARYLGDFARRIFHLHYGGPFSKKQATTKGELKDAIVAYLPYTNPRIAQMTALYNSEPGRFYRETPFRGMLYYAKVPHSAAYIGSTRIKRVRRLAEKGARRIIDRIYGDIKSRAEVLARNRALSMGTHMEALVTSPQEMEAEFLRAEERLLDDLKNGRPIFDESELVIQDVAGVKIVVEDHQRSRFFNRVAEMKDCQLIEIEKHQGKYNAVNLIVGFQPDRRALLENQLDDEVLAAMQVFGFSPPQIQDEFRRFILSGEDRVHIEVIVCSYQEMLESEIGICMHEDRILRQRLTQQYNSQLARNIEFLMIYLFAFSASPDKELEDLPIRLWDCYLPDYFDDIFSRLSARAACHSLPPMAQSLASKE